MTTAIVLDAQENPAATPAQPANSSQHAQRDFRFDVASIRPVDAPGPRYQGSFAPAYTPGRFHSQNETIVGLAFKAFGKKQVYELKYPEWMLKTYYDVNATLPEGATKADLPVMIQHLLEDRFALQAHHETRQMNGYELMMAKSGSKFTKSEGPPPDRSAAGGPPQFPVMKDGVPQFTKDSGPAQLYTASPAGLIAWWHGRDESMQRLASDIAGQLKTPVSDGTGLDGKYDFSLNFIEENPHGQAGTNGASTPSEYSPLPDALVQQLGLRLKSVKNVPVDVVVLDSANKQPTEN